VIRATYQPTDEGISEYHKLFAIYGPKRGDEASEQKPVRIFDLEILDSTGRPSHHFPAHEEATFRSTVCFLEAVENPHFGLVLETDSGQTAYFDSTHTMGTRRFGAGEYVTCEIHVPLRLVSGSYRATIGVSWGRGTRDRVLAPTKPFFVSGRDFVRGVADLGARFYIDGARHGEEA
jgi:hypothetical protein